MGSPAGPTSSTASMLTTLDEATDRLLATAETLDDDALAAPSLLPGWSRAHVIAHLSRNAESHIRLVDGLAQYPTPEARADGIEAGARLSRSALLDDLRDGCRALTVRFAAETDWSAARAENDPRPREVLIAQRLLEVEVHHVDLDAGYTAANWSATFVAALLDDAAATMANAAPLRLIADDGPGSWPIGAGAGVVELHGPAHVLAAWLTGRGAGTGIARAGGGALPTPPRWR